MKNARVAPNQAHHDSNTKGDRHIMPTKASSNTGRRTVRQNATVAHHQAPIRAKYEATDAGLIWHKLTNGAQLPVQLTNFTARIVAEVAEDDGSDEVRRVFEIDICVRGRSKRISVPAERFPSMNWIMEHLGAGAIIESGMNIKDHTRAAIQHLSGEVPERQVYVHTGWRQVGDEWDYLHAGGAIGPHGPLTEVEVRLCDALARYQLCLPPSDQDQVENVRASLRLLDVATDVITVPLLAAVFRAVLGGADFGLHLAGPTGAGKSELAALIQQHWGPELDARHLPGSWASTANALEGLAFTAKDAILVLDDFAPTGSTTDVQRSHLQADRVLRAQGNHSARQRMRADTTLRAAKPPRGLILSTGEDVPLGQSLRARLLVLDLGPDALNWKLVSTCQGDAGEGRYAKTLAGFVQWLAPRYAEVKGRLSQEVIALREQAPKAGHHPRTTDLIANLALGLRYFLDYAREREAITEAEADALWKRGWKALLAAGKQQKEHQEVGEPTKQFLDLLRGCLTAGRAHVATTDGTVPDSAEAWGWRVRGYELQGQGDRIGWVDGDDLYLESHVAYAVAQRFAHDMGDAMHRILPTIKKRLKQQGLLVSTEKRGGAERLEVRRSIEGLRRDVLYLRATSLLEVAQVAQLAKKPWDDIDMVAALGLDDAPPAVVLEESPSEASLKSYEERQRERTARVTAEATSGWGSFSRQCVSCGTQLSAGDSTRCRRCAA
jgi:hypothetical protein